MAGNNRYMDSPSRDVQNVSSTPALNMYSSLINNHPNKVDLSFSYGSRASDFYLVEDQQDFGNIFKQIYEDFSL